MRGLLTVREIGALLQGLTLLPLVLLRLVSVLRVAGAETKAGSGRTIALKVALSQELLR
jgi:hypothetical protein